MSPHFFETIGQPVLRGRGITEQDTATSRMIAVVNQAFVKKFFPNEDPIGRHFGTFDQKYAADYEIVGIVADAKYNNPRDPVRPMYFRPMTQLNTTIKERSFITAETRSLFPNSMTIRYAGDAASLESLVRRTLANINPNLTVLDFKSLDYQVAGNFNQERLITPPDRSVRIAGARPGVGRSVWNYCLLRGPPHQRNRRAHGSRRQP